MLYIPIIQTLADICGLDREDWLKKLQFAMKTNRHMWLDVLGVDTSQLPRPTGWGTLLMELTDGLE